MVGRPGLPCLEYVVWDPVVTGEVEPPLIGKVWVERFEVEDGLDGQGVPGLYFAVEILFCYQKWSLAEVDAIAENIDVRDCVDPARSTGRQTEVREG